MTKVEKVYHVTQMTHDLAATDRWYDDIFSVRRFYTGYHVGAMRDASLVVIGDLCMEPLISSRVPGAENTPMGRFYTRFGPRYHSLALYVDSVKEAYAALKQRNIRMYDVVGKPMLEMQERGAIFTHPKETFGMLELALLPSAAGGGAPAPGSPPAAELGAARDPRVAPGWSTAFWRDQHPLGIERTSHITVLVEDLPKAVEFYRNVLGGKLLHEEERAGDRRSAFLALGGEVLVELGAPVAPGSPTWREHVRYNDGVFAVTFKVKDLGKAVSFLTSKGLRFESREPDTVVVNRGDAFGAVFAFTDRTIPNDKRK